LDGHLSKFDSSVSKLGDKIIDATISVFNKLLKDTQFSPSARKFHYQFNLRELSKVIEGTMLSNASHVKYKASPATLIKLWCHEGKRVFEDRMINNDDMKKFRDF
jgi:dynein heavy chain